MQAITTQQTISHMRCFNLRSTATGECGWWYKSILHPISRNKNTKVQKDTHTGGSNESARRKKGHTIKINYHRICITLFYLSILYPFAIFCFHAFFLWHASMFQQKSYGVSPPCFYVWESRLLDQKIIQRALEKEQIHPTEENLDSQERKSRLPICRRSSNKRPPNKTQQQCDTDDSKQGCGAQKPVNQFTPR